MRSKSILYGAANVPIEPTAESHLTNNVVVNNFNSPDHKVEYKETENPYNGDVEGTTREINETVESYLLKLYEAILLSDNKKLIANVLSKNSIILPKVDLEKVIVLKVGKPCNITTEDIEVGCFTTDPFVKISSIRITDDTIIDFKIAYNKDYLELMDGRHINLKYCLANV